jgi:hypothetical protein
MIRFEVILTIFTLILCGCSQHKKECVEWKFGTQLNIFRKFNQIPLVDSLCNLVSPSQKYDTMLYECYFPIPTNNEISRHTRKDIYITKGQIFKEVDVFRRRQYQDIDTIETLYISSFIYQGKVVHKYSYEKFVKDDPLRERVPNLGSLDISKYESDSLLKDWNWYKSEYCYQYDQR